MPTSVKIEESREVQVARQNKEWAKKYDKVNTKLKESLVWTLGLTAIAFLLPFLFGTLIGWADPEGWPAYRVGVMFGSITATLVFLGGIVATYVYLGENM